MKELNFIKIVPVATLAVAVGSVACSSTPKETKQPNVIMIMCDDLGWGDVGFNGNTVIKTPHLDEMASEGLQLNRFYSASAVSSPTRFSCLTGRNPYRSGVFNANAGILRPEEVTIPELLKEEGYTTGHFGKWHLGSLTYMEKDANRGKVGNTKEYNPPKEHGYDVAFVTESKVPTWDPMITHADKTKITSGGWNAIVDGEESKPYGTYYWDIEGNKVTDNLEGDDSRVVMDRVIPFIESNKENPFLAVVWFHTPHKPCVAGPEYAAMYEGYNDDFKNFAGCVTAMDEQVGRLRRYLKDNGLAENTLIWFCSDNGPENCIADGGGVSGGFRDRKRSLHEGGVRVPACVVWDGVIEAGRVSDMPAVTSDYLPTIVSLLGIDTAKLTNEIDGVDLMPLLRGENMAARNKPIVSGYMWQISINDDQYKLYTKVQTAKSGKVNSVVELFDIVNDPYETTPIEDAAMIEDYTEKMNAVVESYKGSFEGEEYGRASYDKLEQSWEKNSMITR